MDRLLDLLAALAAEGADATALITAFLDETSPGDLSGVEDAALDSFSALQTDEGGYDEPTVTQMERIVSVLDSVRERRQANTVREQEMAQRAADLAARANPAPAEEPAEGDPAADPAAAVEPAPGAPAAQVPATTTASSARPPLPSTRASDVQRIITPPRGSRWAITASADIRGIATGADLRDLDGLAAAVERRLTPMGKLGMGQKQQVAIASLTLTRDQDLVLTEGGDAKTVLDRAADERRLPGGSLTAASVWCSPSEQIYDLCDDLSSEDGMVSIPSITVTHGGVKWPVSPDYDAVYELMEQGVWEWDESKLDNPPKPCVELPCPEWDECRLTPYGLCIKLDILSDRAWPQLYKDLTQRALVAQQHLVNANILKKLQKAANPVAFTGKAGAAFQPGGTTSVLGILELQAEYMRTKSRMRRGATLEVILPDWVKGWIRSDLAKRTGVDTLSVSDAQINAHFTARGLNVQYVYDWAGLPTASAPTAWPSKVEALMYPAGTFVAARQDILTVDGLYDSTLLSQNKKLGLWAEEAICVIKRCHEALYITIDACPDGSTSGTVDLKCPVV